MEPVRPAWLFIAGAGLCSMVFGALYGEFFGPTGVLPALWLDPLESPVQLLVASVVMGGVLLAGAYALGSVNRFREGGWRRAVYAPSGLAGATLFLPVGVEGALFSAGDGHAAQGDGEVCGSAIETGMEIALRLGIRRDIRIDAPQLLVPTVAPPVSGSLHITTGVAEDLHEAARGAARAMVDLLSGRFGLAPEEAYALTSIAGDLRIHEIVNAPRWQCSRNAVHPRKPLPVGPSNFSMLPTCVVSRV